jgi:hypothetical protein
VRAQINVAPYTPDNSTLIVASGKCNNAEEFKPFAVTLNTKTMSYEVDESVTEEDIELGTRKRAPAAALRKSSRRRRHQNKSRLPLSSSFPKPGQYRNIKLLKLRMPTASAGTTSAITSR